jgi:hypothetical protein
MTMTKAEREDLVKLIRQRERVLKSAARQRSAELIADFENQMGQVYSFDQDEVWSALMEAAEHEVERCKKALAVRCRELGIPDRFAPNMQLIWLHRGYDNAVGKRRQELRTMAKSQIEALERKAVTQVELSCLAAHEQVVTAGLTSDAARAFIQTLPSVESLMPALSFAEMADEARPPVAEQLVSANVLRQRRHRERQKALREGAEALRHGGITAEEGDGHDNGGASS